VRGSQNSQPLRITLTSFPAPSTRRLTRSDHPVIDPKLR